MNRIFKDKKNRKRYKCISRFQDTFTLPCNEEIEVCTTKLEMEKSIMKLVGIAILQKKNTCLTLSLSL